MTSKLTKVVAGSLAALTLVAAVAASSTEAQASHRGVGLGILAAGVILGAAAASHYGPLYIGGYRRCYWTPRYDYYGNYIGSRRICEIY